MNDVWLWIRMGFAVLGGWLGWTLGSLDGLVYVLVAFVALDYITGIMRAVVDRTLSSRVSFRGIFRKVLIFVMVAIGHMVDTHIIGPLGTVGDYSAIRTAIIFFYLANEGISLLENAAHIGLPVPEKLRDILAQLHNTVGETGNGKSGKDE